MQETLTEGNNGPFHINVFNLAPEVTEDDLMEYYASANIKKVFRSSREAMDIELATIEDLKTAIDLGDAVLKGKPFFIRTSRYNQRSVRGTNLRGRGRDRDRPERKR